MMFRKISALLLVGVAFLVFAGTTNAASYFTGNLTSAQEVPPNSSTATGFGRVTLNDAETQITASFYWTGLSGNATAGHIHGAAPVGSNAGVLFNMLPAATVSGSVVGATFAVTPTQVADLKAGLWYFNIHTAANPGGEIRGQIRLDAPYLANMTPGQENPPVNSATAKGFGVVSVNEATNQALVTMTWSGLSGNTSAAHYHNGRSGVNGPVVCNFSLAGQPPAGTLTDFLCTFSPAQITALKQGQFYLNVHTSANPGGEIRGQIQRRRSTVVDFDGDSKSDMAIARSSGGVIEWWINNSGGSGVTAYPHGVSTEFSTSRIGAHDFDGDGKDDPWVFRNQASPNAGFLIFQSSNNAIRFEQFGTTGDDPRVVYDYDGDGRADPAVFRTSDDTWYFLGSSNNAARAITYVRWGTTFANPGDFDGDGRGDFCDQQNDNWVILRSSDLTVQRVIIGTGVAFGVPGDYDGDGKTDIGVAQTEGSQLVWYFASSLNPTQNVYLTRRAWGPDTGRVRAQGDYDGDGKTDVAVYTTAAPQAFWVLPANGNPHTYFQWGNAATDFPITGYNAR